MKNKLTRALIIALAVVAVSALTVWATGTPAGTVITNTATLDYKDVNGNSKAQVTDSVTTTVLTKRGVDVSPATYTVGVTEDKITEYAFTITNTGNATDTIALSVAGLAGWTYEILWDADGDGAWDTTEETDVTSTGALLQDTTYKVIVRVTAPSTEDLNASDTITLTATSSDAVTYDTGVITLDLSSAVVDVTKVASTTTPVYPTDFTFTITVANTDLETAAYNVVVTDTLDTDLVYVSNSATLGSAVHSSGLITWTIGTLAANTTATLTITVHVGQEVPEGNAITNTANLSYADYNGNTYTDSASSVPGTTQELASVDIATTYTSPTDVDPGDTITIPFTVQNTGNGTDNFNLSYTDGNWTLTDATTTPIVWTFYVWTDTDNDGVVDAGEVGTTPVTSTGDLAMNATAKLVAVATVPTNAAYTASSTVTITATSTSDTTEPYTTDSISVTNNVIAPLLTLDKTVDKASAQPGETLTYTLVITNIGDGLATGVTLVDAIPANTTYVANSVTINAGTQTDAPSDDYTVVAAGVITVTPPNMAAGDVVTIKFKVTIN